MTNLAKSNLTIILLLSLAIGWIYCGVPESRTDIICATLLHVMNVGLVTWLWTAKCNKIEGEKS